MSGGICYLVGAGPGDPGLVTLRARELIGGADVVVYDYLCNPVLLTWAQEGAEKVYAGKMASQHTLTQGEINALLVRETQAGKRVVRLKGGDPYVFGRGGEEAQALAEAGCAWEEVPGITSPIAAAAYAGIPVTHRDFTTSVTFVTGHEDPTKSESGLDWAILGKMSGTRIFLMGVERVRIITQKLMDHGTNAGMPMALVRWGTRAQQETLTGTVGTMADLVESRGFKPPAIMIVGQVVKLRETLNWFEKRPLFGKRVVVTRTRTQASELTRLLTEAGGDVLEIATIRTERKSLSDGAKSKLRNLAGHFDWLVFTSPNGVDHFFAQFFEVQPEVRSLAGVKIAVVGPATARRLAEYRLVETLRPEEFTVAALVKALGGVEVKGQRFCLARGNRATPELSQALIDRGAQVVEWVVYETGPEREDRNGARERYQREGADWILFASGSAAEHWQALGLVPDESARRPRVGSIGPVTSEVMVKLGYEVAFEADEHTIPGLVAALKLAQ
jgi:uroporphyrinogen III methyltransferase / synthase